MHHRKYSTVIFVLVDILFLLTVAAKAYTVVDEECVKGIEVPVDDRNGLNCFD